MIEIDALRMRVAAQRRTWGQDIFRPEYYKDETTGKTRAVCPYEKCTDRYNTVEAGYVVYTAGRQKKRWKCNNCGRRFTSASNKFFR